MGSKDDALRTLPGQDPYQRDDPGAFGARSFELSRVREQISPGGPADPTAVLKGDRESPVGIVSRTANDHG